MRAAELLEASGAASGVGFNVPLVGAESAKFGGEDAVDCSDVDFVVVIKRMAKKDSTTKLKVIYIIHSVNFCRQSREPWVWVLISERATLFPD